MVHIKMTESSNSSRYATIIMPQNTTNTTQNIKRKRQGGKLNNVLKTPKVEAPDHQHNAATATASTPIVQQGDQGNATTTTTPQIPNTNDNVGNVNDVGDESGLVTVKFDTKAFQCHFCSSPLQLLDIKYCNGGHIACTNCSNTNFKDKKCSECSSVVTTNNCKPLINILNAITIDCCFASLGCKFRAPYFGTEKQKHEKNCFYQPCLCPIDGCTFKCAVTPLSSHIISSHYASLHTSFTYNEWFKISLSKDTPFHVLLERSKDEPVFILLNGNNLERAGPGRCLSIVCMRSENECNKYMHYEIKMKIVGVNAEDVTEFYIKSATVDVVVREKKCPGEFMYVPNNMLPDNGMMDLDIRIV